jgi:hypothetical protein
MEAKAGDEVSKKALGKLVARLRGPSPAVNRVVQPKTETEGGQWFCIDCGELPQNNMEAHSHAGDSKYASHPGHRLGWLRIGDPCTVEQP